MFALVIFANSITADMGMVPGFAPAGPALGLPLSVLAAFVERPFYTAAGVERGALRYSLQANFLSLLAGFALFFGLIPIVMSPGGGIFGWLVPFSAVGLSVWVEGSYLRSVTQSAKPAWGWVVAANVVSATVCICVMLAAIAIRESYPAFAREFQPMNGWLHLGVAIMCLGMFIGSFYGSFFSFLSSVKLGATAPDKKLDAVASSEPTPAEAEAPSQGAPFSVPTND